MCADAAGNGTGNGTLIELESCSTSTKGEIWDAGTNGSWVNPNSGKCLADTGNSTTNGTQTELYTCNSGVSQDWASVGGTTSNPLPGTTQTIKYTPQGQTQSVTSPVGTTTQVSSYVYDADGNLLVQEDPGQVIYYIGDSEEILYNTSSKTTTGLRLYPAPDGTTTILASSGADPISYTTANQQGTALESINATTLAITRRYYDPYGNQLTTTASWPDNKAFVNQPADPATGLGLLGARQYNPVTGAFLSLDPVFEAGDPAQMGGYTYAADNPATLSDPSGLYIPVESGSDCSDNSCTIQYKQDNGEGFNYSDAISYDNNQGSWSDLAGGAVNKLYDAAKPVIAAVLPGADGMLPDRIPLGNPNTTSYGAGGFYVNLALLGIPGGDEADVADIGLGVVADDTGKTVQTLYRADTRSTADIFSGGFKTKGDNMDIVQHVKMNSPDSGFVATSNSLTSAQNFAAEIRADYIYKLTGNGIDVNALFGDDSPFPWENEIAVPGGVGAGSIEGAWGPDGWISNPGYAP